MNELGSETRQSWSKGKEKSTSIDKILFFATTILYLLASLPRVSAFSPQLPLPTLAFRGMVHNTGGPKSFTSTTAVHFGKNSNDSNDELAKKPELKNYDPVSSSWPETQPLFPNVPREGLALAAVAAALYLSLKCFVVVEAGDIGIASTLGSLERYDPGPHLRNPIVTSVTNLSTKTELLEQSNFVPTKEGLTVELDTAVLVKIDPQKAIGLYKSVGPDYLRKLVAPETSSSVRGLTSESEAKALYTSGRSELQNGMRAELKAKLEPKGILVEDVLLKNVVLPKDLSQSIQEKARAEQESARMEFVLLKESQEAERKAIEAKGIADFQTIVSEGITPSLLQWKGIEATEKLAKSPNSKVVIVGNSKDSLPVILGANDK